MNKAKMIIPKCSYLPNLVTLRSIIPLAPENYLFEFTHECEELKRAKPGQFVQLWIAGVGEAPISICSSRLANSIELCVRKVGRVTDALYKLKEGSRVGLRGPFGNGFPLEKFKHQNLCLIAGGLGFAPIRSLLQYILDHREEYKKLVLVYGMRHSDSLLFKHELKFLLSRHDLEVYIAAEEIVGPDLPPISMQLGRVTDMLGIASLDESYFAAICGPPVMYKFVINSLKAQGIRDESIYMSLERHMKCGVGKCGHCFVGGRFTCKDGPVFSLSELRFLPEVNEV